MRRSKLPDDLAHYAYPAIPAEADHERHDAPALLGRQLVVVETWRAWVYRIAAGVGLVAMLAGWITQEDLVAQLGSLATLLGLAPAIARTKAPRRG